MKIVFAGTPEFAVPALENIINNGYEVVGVVTQADKPQGRKGILTPPPVKTFALEKNIPVIQPLKLKDEISLLKDLGGDIMVTCAYGQILTQEVLDLFKYGVWNIHAGLLPKYRGASPIQSCILAGETQTGVSIMKTELGLDSGDILWVQTTDILPNETYGELSVRLSNIGAKLIVTALKTLSTGEYTLTKQAQDGVQTVRKINKENARVRFEKTACEIACLVRAMNPAPVAWSMVSGNAVNIYAVEIVENETLTDEEKTARVGEVISDSPKRGLLVRCNGGAVKLLEVQGAGGKRMKGGDFLNGRKVQKGQVFEC